MLKLVKKYNIWKLHAIGNDIENIAQFEDNMNKEYKIREKQNILSKIENLKSKRKKFEFLKINLLCNATKLDKKDFFGKSDPLYQIIINNKKIYESEHVVKTLNPNWKLAEFDIRKELLNKEVIIKVWDWNLLLNHSLIGEFHLNFDDLKKDSSFDLKNKNKKSGNFHVISHDTNSFFKDDFDDENDELELIKQEKILKYF
jgi:hypothetical protein